MKDQGLPWQVEREQVVMLPAPATPIKKLTDINRCLTDPANSCLTDV